MNDEICNPNRPTGSERGYQEEFTDPGSVAEHENPAISTAGQSRLWTYKQLFRSRNFWLLSIGIGLMQASDQALLASQVPHFQDLGFDIKTAALLASVKTFSAIGGKSAAGIGVSGPVKPASRAAIAALHDLGLKVAMITGDNEATAQAIAAKLGIDEVVAEVLPEGKVAAIERLQTGGSKVAFVGDGINDAPALARADVGIAIGTGTDVAIESADVVLMSGDLKGVVNALHVSQRTMRNIRQNLFWAFGYNALLIPVAAGVFYPLAGLMLSPALAAGAMALSSVFVLSNALRLRWVAPELSESAANARQNRKLVSAPAE